MSGLAPLLQHLLTTLATVTLVAMAAGVGLRIAPMRERPLHSPLLALASATALGLGVVATLLLLITAAGGVTPAPIWAAMAMSAVIALSGAGRVLALLKESAREWSRIATLPANIAMAFVIGLLWINAVPDPVDFDSLMYHLRGVEQYLLAGRIVAPEGNGHVAYIGAIHTLYLPFLLLKLNSSPALLQAVFVPLTIAAAAAVADSWFRQRAGWVVVVIALGSPIVMRVGSTAMVDGSAAAILFIAHAMLLAAYRRPRVAREYAAVAGALLGIAVGAKILSAAYAVATAVVLVPLLFARARSRRSAPVLVGIALSAAVLAAAPWLARTTALYGSPTYPYLAEKELPAWTARSEQPLAPLTGTSALRNVREPFTLTAWFLTPEKLTPEGDGYLFGANPAFLLLLLLPFVPRARRHLAIVLPALLFLGFVLLWSRFLNLRYLLPLLWPLTLSSAVVLASLWQRFLAQRQAQLATLGVSLAIIATPTIELVREVNFSERPLAAIGAMDAAKYRSRHNEIELLASHLNQALPDSARVLFLFEARAFGIKRTVLQDNVMENWRLLRPRVAEGSCLSEFGITHIVLGRATLQYLIGRGWNAESAGIPEMDAFLQRCTIGATGNGLHMVYTMRPAAPGA